MLGTWESKFAVSDKDRNFNLKLAASHINGHVIPPGGDFSFNDVVGERSEKQGYKIAHVIQAGEVGFRRAQAQSIGGCKRFAHGRFRLVQPTAIARDDCQTHVGKRCFFVPESEGQLGVARAAAHLA